MTVRNVEINQFIYFSISCSRSSPSHVSKLPGIFLFLCTFWELLHGGKLAIVFFEKKIAKKLFAFFPTFQNDRYFSERKKEGKVLNDLLSKKSIGKTQAIIKEWSRDHEGKKA